MRYRSNETDRLNREQQRLFQFDVARIGRYFDEEFERNGARGLVVFSSSFDNLWRVLRLSQSVPDLIKIRRRLFLTPLVPLAGAQGKVVVVVVGRERGQIWLLDDGRFELLVDHFEEQPGRHDQGGWSQARYARHIESLVHEHLREVAAELDRRSRRLHPAGLVVVASEETRPEIEQLLSSEAHGIFLGWAQADAHAGASELREAVRPLVEHSREEREVRIIERWQEEAGRGGRACRGWAKTLEAASDGRIELLIYQSGSERGIWVCGACGRISAEAGNCPLDGTTAVGQEDGLDLLVHETLERGGSVIAVQETPLLTVAEGVGALLRY